MPQIHHYTITTGDGRLTDRREVADHVIEMLRPIVAAGGGELPGGMELRIVVSCGESVGGWLYTIYVRDAPLVSCGLAVDENAAAELWPHLMQLAEVGDMPRARKPPPLPWLSVVILPGLAGQPQELVGMLGDLERCIAWTLLKSEENQ